MPHIAALVSTQDAPKSSPAILILQDDQNNFLTFHGQGFGAHATKVGELCFTTSMTGYQETLTDPSYAEQIITFTFPHIGNVGTNAEDLESDIETAAPKALGLITRELPTPPSNYRATENFGAWLKQNNLVGLAGVDTRAITHFLRDHGAAKAVLSFNEKGTYDEADLQAQLTDWPGLEDMDLAKPVTCKSQHTWQQTTWSPKTGYGNLTNPTFRVAVIDYGCKHNILRNLTNLGCDLTIFPATASAEDVMSINPDGVFLSNGPGDPAATGEYAVPVIKEILNNNIPTFGICLGHQMLCLAIGAQTGKMHTGHRGANHPVKDLATGKVEITSQNHGFMVDPNTLPANAKITHVSLFDNTLEGIELTDKPAFSVQFHPEASPGPQDSHYLFKRFTNLMEIHQKQQRGAA